MAVTLGVMTQVALLSPFIQCKVLQTGLGLTASKPVHLPKQAGSCGRPPDIRSPPAAQNMCPLDSTSQHHSRSTWCCMAWRPAPSAGLHLWRMCRPVDRLTAGHEPDRHVERTKKDRWSAQVEADVLKLVLSYCRYHRAEGRSDKERKLFDEKFIRMDTRRLCELTSAADA